MEGSVPRFVPGAAAKEAGIADADIQAQGFERADTNEDGQVECKEFAAFCCRVLHGSANDKTRSVVLKFMSEKDQFERERDVRKEQKLDAYFVVGTLAAFDGDDDAIFAEAVAKEASRDDLKGFNYALVLISWDRNLQEILVKERPDVNATRALMQQVGTALKHLHDNGVMHGDLKMLNVVRVGERLQLIDLDAAATIDEGHAGAKFSSGTLPPEMFAVLDEGGGDAQQRQFGDYFAEERDGKTELWRKMAPTQTRNHF